MKIYPSIMAADYMNVGSTIKMLDSSSDGYHLDVMDFHFVPNLTFGVDFINSFRKITDKSLFVHSMIERPDNFFDFLKLNSGDYFCWHIENLVSHQNLIDMATDKKLKTSLAIKPKTSIEEISNYASRIDHVLLMSVEPGYSGQKFLENTYIKLEELIDFKNKYKFKFAIGLDGGINRENFGKIKQFEIDDLAIGSGIFNGEAINNLNFFRK